LFVVKVWVLYYFTVIRFVQCPSHIFYIINCHAKHETEDLQMDIHPGLGVLATADREDWAVLASTVYVCSKLLF
jgi:hypothetical protein